VALLGLLLLGSLVRAQDSDIGAPENPNDPESPPPTDQPSETPPPTDQPSESPPVDQPSENPEEQPPPDHTQEPPGDEIPVEGEAPTEPEGGEPGEQPVPGPPECSCTGLDYTDGGSYLVDGNSDQQFSFNSVFYGSSLTAPVRGVSRRANTAKVARWVSLAHY